MQHTSIETARAMTLKNNFFSPPPSHSRAPPIYGLYLLKELPVEYRHCILVVTELLHISGIRRSRDD